MKNYRLAIDENGSPFVLNSKGSINFGYITEEMNLSPAPIRVAEGNSDSCLLEVSGGKHNDTLFIRLFQDEGYWKVISGGVFNLRYSKKKIYSGSDNRPPQPASDGEGLVP